MKIFVTGAAGQLGHDVINELDQRNRTGNGEFTYIASDVAPAYSGAADGTAVTTAPYVPLDITDAAAVERTLAEIAPDAVIHCAAWTAVDLAEEEDKKEKVRLVNSVGTDNIVSVVKKLDNSLPGGCKMMYISTDYVFNGQGTAPWEADCKEYAPLNVYGQTKLEGEQAVSGNLTKYFIIRIAWVFGQNGKNFIKTILNLGKTHDRLTVVCDQIGTPTYTLDLSVLLCDMIVTEQYGYYHATNSEVSATGSASARDKNPSLQCPGENQQGNNLPAKEGYTSEGCKTGYISWYDFTKEIFRQAAALGYQEYDEAHLTVVPVTTAVYGASKAARPFNSRLDKKKLEEKGFAPLPTWQNALERYLPEILANL